MANDFLTFAGDPAANVMTQANYANVSFTARLLGFSSGTALSLQLNKVWRQASLISTMLANFTVTETGLDMLDDGTTSGMTNLQNHFRAAVVHVVQTTAGVGYLPLTGGTLTGPLVINSAGFQIDIQAPAGTPAGIYLDSAAGQYTMLVSRTNTVLRWQLLNSDNAPETGSNAGSNWSLNRYSDNGTFLGTPISISRATGIVNFSGPPTLSGGPLPYLSIGGGNLSGALSFSAGLGILYAVGSYGAWVEYGWDGAILAWINGSYIGHLATQDYTNAVAGGYLPLSGGTLTGALQCNSSLIVNGGAGFRSSVWFANIGDFVNFTDGRYRYRQWAGNWHDSWDGNTGNRQWWCAGGQYMRLDGAGNLDVYGFIHTETGRVMNQHPYAAPCYGLWKQNTGAMGMWFDGNLVFGPVDGSANPSSSVMWLSGGGQLTVTAGIYAYSTIQSGSLVYSNGDVDALGNMNANGSLGLGYDCTVGRFLTVNNELYAHSNIWVSGTATAGYHHSYGDVHADNALTSGNDLVCGRNAVVYGSLQINNVVHGYGPGKMVLHAGNPAYTMDWVGHYAMGIALGYIDAAMTWHMMDASGNAQNTIAFLNTNGVWGGSYFQTWSGRQRKENIAPAADFDSLGAVRAMPIFSYDTKDGDLHRDFGFIAEEVESLLPDVVTSYGEEGPTIDVVSLIAHAYRAIAQLAARVDAAH